MDPKDLKANALKRLDDATFFVCVSVGSDGTLNQDCYVPMSGNLADGAAIAAACDAFAKCYTGLIAGGLVERLTSDT